MSKYVDRLRKSLEIRSNQGEKRIISWQDLLAELVAPQSYRNSPARMINNILTPASQKLVDEGIILSFEITRQKAWACGFGYEAPISVLFTMKEEE